jgi:hypothetical protein
MMRLSIIPTSALGTHMNELTGADGFQGFQHVRDQRAKRFNAIVDSEKDDHSDWQAGGVLLKF